MTEIVGNRAQFDQITHWLSHWIRVIYGGQKVKKYRSGDEEQYYNKYRSRGLLVSGPPGIGKSIGVKLLIASLNFSPQML
jgi:DNA polymerase III delta prime subunit